jgi:hypothetical protein
MADDKVVTLPVIRIERHEESEADAAMRRSGAYRKITREEAEALDAQGAAVDWAEGVGYVVFDAQALEECQAEAAKLAEVSRLFDRPRRF